MAMVQIHKAPRNGEAFLSLNKELLFTLLMDLTHSELRLYLFLSSNRDEWKLPFSKQLIQNEIGLSKNSFYLARDGLIRKGYLLMDEKTGDYSFYENSLKGEK